MATAAQIKTFIQQLGALAVAECNRRIAAGQGIVLPSVCIAQAALETGYGTSGLMTRAKAYFGIKAGGSWTGAVYRADTWEVANGTAYNTSANFRAYSSVADSVTDYYNLIANASRYANSLSYGTDRSAWKTPRQCITAIWQGGYATDPNYVSKIMSMIDARNLTTYDAKITGVSGDLIPSDVPNKLFSAANHLIGTSLIIADSGRSIQNNADASAFALATGFTTAGYSVYKIDGLGSYQMYLATLQGDVAEITGPYSNGATLEIPRNSTVRYYIKKEDGSAFTDQEISDLGTSGFAIFFDAQNDIDGFTSGSARYTEPIAFFVKIE